MVKVCFCFSHSRNGNEKRILDYKIDGWDAENQTVYEFHGCVFHGCPTCYRPESFNVLKNETMKETFRKHSVRMTNIKKSTEVKQVFEIKRNKNEWTVHTNNIENIYRLVYDKRIKNIHDLPCVFSVDDSDGEDEHYSLSDFKLDEEYSILLSEKKLYSRKINV